MGEKKEVVSPLESLANCIAFDSKDWSISGRDAWVYGIVLGWDQESLMELQHKFQWSDDTCERLIELHQKFEDLRGQTYNQKSEG